MSADNCSCGNGRCEDCAREMIAAILAVRQLHRPIKPHPRGLQVCAACSALAVIREPVGPRTRPGTLEIDPRSAGGAAGHRAGVAYPCATIRTLDAKGAPLGNAPTA